MKTAFDWARIEAARRGSSVSRMLGDFMAELMQREDASERAYLAWRTDERSWQAQPKEATKSVQRVAQVLKGLLQRLEFWSRGMSAAIPCLSIPRC
ncbi:hypothetical protein J4714_13710 [Staphylococcus epidermidis]|nr:hypothetical protein [Staphylococcus epidermidis]